MKHVLSQFVTFAAMASFALAAWSCTEFLSLDVSDQSLEIGGPSDSLFTSEDQLSFWWEAETEAEAYRFQLVNPSFSNPLTLFDTLLEDVRMDLLLSEGRYQWRLRAENTASQSPYQTYHLFVDLTAPDEPMSLFPLAGDTVQLDQAPLEFRWRATDSPLDGESYPPTTLITLQVGSQILLDRSPVETGSLDVEPYLSDLAPGSYKATLTLVAQDLAGQQSPAHEASFTLVIP
ncbi:MAG: hypothetical protein AAF804_19880 [Bacteroidota bacterium]